MRPLARAIAVTALTLSVSPVSAASGAVDVPLALWTSQDYPNGLDLGGTMGVSFGDYDGDGFVDVFACWSGNLWRNVGGTGWELVGNLSSLVPPTERRYGSSLGDYDGDGRPDIAMAPRVPAWGDDTFHLLHNLGAGGFEDVASDPSIVDVQPYGNAETLCWADVNGDGRLDLFVPVYPDSSGGPGNFFLLNAGPTGPGGAARFTEASAVAGLDNPPGTARPEGAQFADVDGDGDVDLYAGGTLYQNVSTSSGAQFNPLPESISGIGLSASRDEGALFFDDDLDGDFDLFVAYADEGVRIWDNRGDGTFAAADPSIIDSPMTGLDLGMSAEDWDNDGDIDFTTRGVFRRNMLIETGARHFTVATTTIPASDLTSATPAWGDWDKDGDLDCALGNWGQDGKLYENTLYGPETPAAAKRDVRLRLVRDSLAVPRGLETEYGAVGEIRVLDPAETRRRRKFVASASGYLNQNEYTLTFGLPPDPYPADPGHDVRFDASADFPGLSAGGVWRIDRHVNPALGGIDLADLTDREIAVTRCGEVTIGGEAHHPIPLASPTLLASGGGLALPGPGAPLPEPSASPQSDWWIGLAFDVPAGPTGVIVEEVDLDAQLEQPVTCMTGTFNIVFWDVTDTVHPTIVPGGIVQADTLARNRRTAIPVDVTLPPGRSYRVVALVTSSRPTPIGAPAASGALTVRGGLSFRNQTACNGQKVAGAVVTPARTALAVRFVTAPASSLLDPVGGSLRLTRDAAGEPVLSWKDVGAPGYVVSRCPAAGGPCTPERHASTASPDYTDTGVSQDPGESYWYLVRAVNACTAGL